MRGTHTGFLQEYEKTLRTVLDAPGLDTMGLEARSPHRLKSVEAFSEKYHDARDVKREDKSLGVISHEGPQAKEAR
jgi:hypothetical protein